MRFGYGLGRDHHYFTMQNLSQKYSRVFVWEIIDNITFKKSHLKTKFKILNAGAQNIELQRQKFEPSEKLGRALRPFSSHSQKWSFVRIEIPPGAPTEK